MSELKQAAGTASAAHPVNALTGSSGLQHASDVAGGFPGSGDVLTRIMRWARRNDEWMKSHSERTARER